MRNTRKQQNVVCGGTHIGGKSVVCRGSVVCTHKVHTGGKSVECGGSVAHVQT